MTPLAALLTADVSTVALGYSAFYGRVTARILPIRTRVPALRLSTFLGRTAGYERGVGDAKVSGYNGTIAIPALRVGELTVQDYAFLCLVCGIVLVCYSGARTSVNAHRGQ